MENSRAADDKRCCERIPADISLRFLNMYANRWSQVKMHDISIKGVGLVTEELLAPNTLLQVWLPVPGKDESLYAWGSVAWSKPDEPDRYRTGVSIETADLSPITKALRTA